MKGRRVHFVGIGGAGMSSLAAVLAARGAQVTGSDRDHDRGVNAPLFRWLTEHGIRVLAQDGTGVRAGVTEVVASGAVEAQVSELQAARAGGLPVRHRSELLAEILHAGRGVAVAGTSGKSTVTAMIAWILRDAGLDPTFVGGAPLIDRGIRPQGTWPGPAAWNGGGEVAVVEADESDGSLVRYWAEVGVVTNVSADHRPLPELRQMFRRFATAARGCLVVPAAGPESAALVPCPGARRVRFGRSADAEVRAERIEIGRDGASFRVKAVPFRLGLPGRFNVENALAAVAVARHFGVPDRRSAQALEAFPGLSRRMERVGEARGVEVIDDFAHNPDKVVSALEALRVPSGRLRLVFQLHGFAPARMHRRGLVEAFSAGLRQGDRLYLLPIYFAGGTVGRDVSSADYAADLCRAGVDAVVAQRDDALLRRLAADCEAGDRAVIMGARDPSLRDLARCVLVALQSAPVP